MPASPRPSPPSAGQAAALDALADEVAALFRRGLEPVVVFDLDDTLLSTDRRHLRILREFAEHSGVSIEPPELKYQIVETARAAGVADEGVLSRLRGFWFPRFFANEYLLEDEPVPGAAEYCRELAARGATVVYMTGRDEKMREGTVGALARHSFPAPDGAAVRLILKPTFETPDLEYKTAALEGLAELGVVAGAFENEPAHVNLFADRFAHARLYLLETKHSGKPVTACARAHRIKDFARA